ncbi:diguanylate cyclase domain-containing protein [Pseudoduganella sp. GCM10020061]|uniref:sensor domain-containing diguanylate cyclase n=1 Tax=Pseudoduganella sp. GCM10020061 TaxID=3317345 RepID=UPI0036272A52
MLKRLALFLAASLSIVWGGVALEHANLRKISQIESNRTVNNLARAFSEEVNSTISTVDVALLSLRRHYTGNREDFGAILGEFNRELTSKVIFQIAVTDKHGIVAFLSSGPVKRRIDVSDREHVATLLRDPVDRLVISRPLVGRASGVLGVQFARPVFDRNGQLAAIIVASVSPEYFSRFYNQLDLGNDTSISLVRSGVVLARNSRGGSNRYIGATLAGYPYDDSVREHGGGFRRVSRLDGVERFYGWRRLPNYNLVVTVGQSVLDAQARYAERQRFATVMGAVLSLALLVLGWGAITARYIRARAQRAMAIAEARWQLALNASGAGVWDWEVPTGVMMLTPRAQALLGIAGPSIAWSFAALKDRIHPDDLPHVTAALRDLIEGRSPDYSVEYRVERAPGVTAWVQEHAMVVDRSESGAVHRVVGTVTNIDERKSHEEQMRHMASHDTLTGLANRALFGDRLQQAILLAQREKTRLAVIYFDLDKFKPVNDTFGHATGDQLLIGVASRVRGGLRQSDTLARLGGDEFAVLLPNCSSAAAAQKVASGILALLNEPFIVDGNELHISGSIGVSVFPDCGEDAAQLVHHADQAMYRSKQEGRNRVTLYCENGAC